MKHASSRVELEVVADKESLTFTVSDDGPGFQDKRFVVGEPLPTNELTKKPKTTGFGLEAAQRLVDGRGGRMWVNEPLFKPTGASISFTIPGKIVP